MRVGVLGINHKLADLRLREAFAKSCHFRFHPEKTLHPLHHLILLSTCNRTEVYFCSNELSETHSYLLNILRQDLNEDFDQKLYSFFGRDCFLHLCRVTAGLDSAIIAETEIQGQVKRAYENAQEYQQLPYSLHYLFQKSLSLAKRIRAHLPIKPGLPDVEHAIFQTGIHLFKSYLQTKVLFIGASEINQRIVSFFKQKNFPNLYLCNRSYERGDHFAKEYDLQLIPWENRMDWIHFDWIILGTKCPDYLIESTHLPASVDRTKLIIDLSVPRNADPQLARLPNITLLNIDQINRRLRARKQHLAQSLIIAEGIALEATSQHIERFSEKERIRINFLRGCLQTSIG